MNPEDYIQSVLNTLGYTAQKIQESSKDKSPDFFVSGDGFTYLIELKTKLSDAEKKLRRDEILQKGEIASESESTGRRNRLSGVLRIASKQLSEYKGQPVRFRLVWMPAQGNHPDIQMLQFEATLYGKMDIIDMTQNGFLSCYYFTHSDFYTFRDSIDGAIISTGREAKFCLNTYSANYQLLRDSPLFNKFRPGVLDPLELEKEGFAFIADCGIERGNENAMISYLCSKYKKDRLMPIQMGYHSASVRVQKE
jgi:hypothetical protein